MREVPNVMTARWYSGLYVGDAKPMARVTVHKPNIELFNTQENLFASLMFGGGGTPKELPNVKSVSWERGIDQDVASCTIEFYNVAPLPIGQTPRPDELDQPGYYTYNRGATPYSSRWGHTENEWAKLLMPDNILRTFEGYGFDADVVPEYDPNLVQTGVWMIDEVDITAAGTITVTCRDTGRMLLDHISFPPVTPFESGFKTKDLPLGAYAYPVLFRGENTEPYSFTEEVPQGPQRLGMSYRTSSNFPYSGHGAQRGHFPRQAFDESDKSYFLSVGNARPDQGYSYEWVEGSIKKQRVRRVRFKSLYAPHTAYLSLYADGRYVGGSRISYDPNHPVSAPNGADINYVQARQVSGTGWTEFDLGDGYENVTRVRVTLGALFNSRIGPFPYRAGVRRFEAYGGATSRMETTTVTFEDKNYDDYTDIVKLFCAWGGFYWPRRVVHMVGEVPGDAFYMTSEALVRERIQDIRANRGLPPDPESDEIWVQRIWFNGSHTIGQARTDIDAKANKEGAEELLTDGGKRWWPFARDDRAMTIKFGRVWGDFQLSGTYGPAPLTEDIFDKKPLMDGIAYVRDILGYIFHIDELGGAVFRPPNIYNIGNLFRSGGPSSGTRTKQMVTIDETQILMDVGTKLTSANIRERTFVSNADGTVGGMAKGWNPNPIGMRRMGGWSDQGFETNAEALTMAETIALAQLFTYRTDQITIPGYPGIQIDDQVRIFERVTSEGYVHYIKGLSSSLDLESGQYTYSLDTHWLGESPFKKWAFDPKQLSKETQDYLANLYREG